MKRFLFLILAFAILLPSPGLANVEEAWQWHTVDGEPKRTLHVCTHSSLSEQWRDWVRQAVEMWNDHSDETGWTFEFVPFSRDQCQVFIVLSDINENTTGGAQINPIDVLEGQDEEPDGRVNGVVITFDEMLELTEEWLTDEEDTSDGVRDGWSTAEGEGTRDPVDTIAHELSHALRLDHHEDYDPRNTDEDISDPRKNGEHEHELSETDIRQAREAAQTSQREGRDEARVDADGARNLELGVLRVDIPEYTFGMNYDTHTVTYMDMSALAPVPTNVPGGYSHVFFAFGFFAETAIEQPVRALIPYTDGVLKPQMAPTLNTAEGFFAPGLLEDSITLVRFEKAPWDLTGDTVAKNPSRWVEVDTVLSHQPDRNLIEAELTQTGYYGLAAKANPEQPGEDPGPVLLVDEGRSPGSEEAKAVFTDKPFPTTGFIVGILLGFLAGVLTCHLLWRRMCDRRPA